MKVIFTDTINKAIIRFGFSPILLNTWELIMAVVDILIVAYVLYRVIKWIKETRAWSLFKGLLVIFVVLLFSDFFMLHTIEWIISNTLNVGIIAVIIIFQPEMRKALEQLGKGRIVTSVFSATDDRDSTELSEHSINEIIQAVTEMSKVRTGALIVIQKKVGLADLKSKGIPVDSIISKQLLLNIFEDKTPLHDGAVIIKDNRVSAATCILPLTERDIGSKFGTRHRAAVGASEISDAVVIVVSEETGVISVAQEGTLYSDMHENDILMMLSRDKKPTKFKSVLRKGRANDGES